MGKEELKARICRFVQERPGVTYPAFERLFESLGYEYAGTLDACSSACEHVVFWSGWSAEAYSLLSELIHEQKIKREPCPWWAYLMDGEGMNLPRFEGNDYKQLRSDQWLPVWFVTAGADGRR